MRNHITDLPVYTLKPSEVVVEWPNGSKGTLLEFLEAMDLYDDPEPFDNTDEFKFTDKNNKEISLGEVNSLIRLNSQEK